jgi:hypothetical protein
MLFPLAPFRVCGHHQNKIGSLLGPGRGLSIWCAVQVSPLADRLIITTGNRTLEPFLPSLPLE